MLFTKRTRYNMISSRLIKDVIKVKIKNPGSGCFVHQRIDQVMIEWNLINNQSSIRNGAECHAWSLNQ